MVIVAVMATELNNIGKLIYNVLYGWVNGWSSNGGLLGAFSITVILFTIFLKIITFPFDLWQKNITRKNARIMEKMKPQLEKINKQYANNKEMHMQKQRELYKKNNYSTFASCLPMIITIVIFITVFSGFNSAVRYHNAQTFLSMTKVYNEAINEKNKEFELEGRAEYKIIEGREALEPIGENTKSELEKEQKQAAEKAVVEAYKLERFLFTKNIFVPDTWASPIPTVEAFSKGGVGKLGISSVDAKEYEMVMKPLVEKYNKTSEGKRAWNGYLLLPILALLLNIFGWKLNKPPEQPQIMAGDEEAQKRQQAQTKMMSYMMPLMMAIFAFLYSTAFALYMFINSLITTIFNLVYNIITKRKDEREKDYIMSTTIKR